MHLLWIVLVIAVMLWLIGFFIGAMPGVAGAAGTDAGNRRSLPYAVRKGHM